jgi:hypothetical protein
LYLTTHSSSLTLPSNTHVSTFLFITFFTVMPNGFTTRSTQQGSSTYGAQTINSQSLILGKPWSLKLRLNVDGACTYLHRHAQAMALAINTADPIPEETTFWIN